jgi:hypothetical protein
MIARYSFLLLFIIAFKFSFAQSLYNEIVSYYTFDKNYYTKDRISGEPAKLYGVTYVTDRLGRLDSALHFNGKTWDKSLSDTIIILNDGRFTLNHDSTFSISFWIDKFTETTEMVRWGNFSLNQFANGYVDFPIISGPRFWCTPYENGYDWQLEKEIWDHYVITYDKGLWGIYINGDSVTESFENYPLVLKNSESDIYLGINASNSIDDFYFFKKKLSHSEVLKLKNEDIFNLTSDPLVFKMKFSGNLQEDICKCSPRDSTGSLITDRFENPQSAFLTSTKFEPLIFPYRSDFELSYDSSLSVSLWFKAKESEVCPTDVLVGQGIFKQNDLFAMEFVSVLPCGNGSVDVGKNRGIDSYGQGMIDRFGDKGGIRSQYPQDSWNHLVFTYNGVIWKLFLNNELKGTNVAIDKEDLYANEYLQQHEIVIGASYDSIYLDDIYYYKKVLSVSEIDDLYYEDGFVTAIHQAAILLNDKILEVEIFDFTGRLLYAEQKPDFVKIQELKSRYTGLFRMKYESHVDVTRNVHFPN